MKITTGVPFPPAAVKDDYAAPKGTDLGYMAGIVVDPEKTFTALGEDPKAFVAWFLQVAIGIAISTVVFLRVGAESLAKSSLDLSGQAYNIQSLYRAQQFLNRWVPVEIVLAPVVGLIVILTICGIFLEVENRLWKQRISFRQMFSVVVHSFIPLTIGGILGLAVVLLSPNGAVKLGAPPPWNVLAYIDARYLPVFLYSVFIRLDPFAIWSVALFGVGLARVGQRRIDIASAEAAAFTFWGLWVIVAASVAAMAR
jgi:hypothetical protein